MHGNAIRYYIILKLLEAKHQERQSEQCIFGGGNGDDYETMKFVCKRVTLSEHLVVKLNLLVRQMLAAPIKHTYSPIQTHKTLYQMLRLSMAVYRQIQWISSVFDTILGGRDIVGKCCTAMIVVGESLRQVVCMALYV